QGTGVGSTWPMSPHPVQKRIVDARNWPVNGRRIPDAQAADTGNPVSALVLGIIGVLRKVRQAAPQSVTDRAAYRFFSLPIFPLEIPRRRDDRSSMRPPRVRCFLPGGGVHADDQALPARPQQFLC